MLDQNIAHLQQLTIQKDLNFSDALTYFLDHLSNDPHFLDEGCLLAQADEKRNFYQAAFSPIAKHCDAKIDINSALLIHVKKYDIVHGSFFLSNGSMCVFYFFEKIQMGIAALQSKNNAMTNFFRLSTIHAEGTSGFIVPNMGQTTVSH